MTDTITISKIGAPRSVRLPSLIFGLVFFPLGLCGSAKVALAGFDILAGRPFEGSFLIGAIVSLVSTLVGGAALWFFYSPDEHLVFDGKARTLTSTRTYPFGRVHRQVFDFARVPAPEVIWTDNADLIAGGTWDVKITLPDGRVIKHTPPAHPATAQKRPAETLRDNIAGFMR